jgi:serine/threonine protein kinase
MIEHVHSFNFVHGNIKPDHFLLGLGQHNDQVNIIDFGLTKLFRDPNTEIHIPYRENNSFAGTPRYCSINTHLGIAPSRRDDLESLAYLLIYLLRGSLLWQGLETNSSDSHGKVLKKKVAIFSHDLCLGIPAEFCTFLDYTRALRFDDNPDYNCICFLFRNLFNREGYKYDNIFDWGAGQECSNNVDTESFTNNKRLSRRKTELPVSDRK